MRSTTRRLPVALVTVLALFSFLTPAAHADDTISAECTKSATNLFRCTLSGTVDQAVTEFDWEGSPGVYVVQGVYEMTSGHGTVEFTADKVIVRFDEAYAATHENLRFSAFADVRIDSWHYPSPYSITVQGTKVDLNDDGTYCDEVCQQRPTEGVYKTLWDGENGSVNGQVVLGKTDATRLVGQEVTVKENGGAGLEGCVITDVQVQDATDRRQWNSEPFTGEGTDTAKFTVRVEEAHRAMFTCSPVDGATEVTNTALINGQELTASWTRRTAGADGEGDSLPSATPTPTPTASDTPSETPTPTTTPSGSGRPGLPKTGD